MEKPQELLTKLEVAISNLRTVIDRFPPIMREDILFDQWSLKDFLAHFSGWNLLTISELTRLQNGLKTDKWIAGQDTDEFNKQSVAERKSRSWEEIYSEFNNTQALLLLKYKELSEEDWNAQFGPSEEDTPLSSIETDIKHIGHDHLVEIEEFQV